MGMDIVMGTDMDTNTNIIAEGIVMEMVTGMDTDIVTQIYIVTYKSINIVVIVVELSKNIKNQQI